MVKVRDISPLLANGALQIDTWLTNLGYTLDEGQISLIESAVQLARIAGEEVPGLHGHSCLAQGLATADTLSSLPVGPTTLAAAILYPCHQYAELSIDDITEHLGSEVGQLVIGMSKMQNFELMQNPLSPKFSKNQSDNIRKMLLTMVDDVRVVLIKLAEQIVQLRFARIVGSTLQKKIAQESSSIYAPLANRLGITELKWELEDLSFSYLDPNGYKTIAKDLNQRRLDRERYVKEITQKIKSALFKAGLTDFTIAGRVKHIFSIHKKMKRKQLTYPEIYDAHAIRILAQDISQCYQVLSTIHTLWEHIPNEFDDYIAQPKDNGYRSLHTVLRDGKDRVFEVQIRTFDMHKEAESGMAAHWAYKEDRTQKPTLEGKIAWLRELLAWQKELTDSEHGLDNTPKDFLDDRIYVFTPQGDIIDLPIGSTPIDFAYHIHSDVGHRCSGAKINGKIVQLSHVLQTGDRVEILSKKFPEPSKDWLNKNMGYVKSPRAKAKILHWFNQQDYKSHLDIGKAIFDKELKRLNITELDKQILVRHNKLQSDEELFVALGRGDIKPSQLIDSIEYLKKEQTVAHDDHLLSSLRPAKKTTLDTEISILGVGDLLTHPAKCCKPIPHDTIVGYITQGRGISIHRNDCPNILHATEFHQERLIEVNWGTIESQHYPVDIVIQADDRQSLLKDITQILSSEQINLIAMEMHSPKNKNFIEYLMTVEVHHSKQLNLVFEKIHQLNNVINIKRKNR